MASYKRNMQMQPAELVGEIALHLYDFYFRPLYAQYMMHCAATHTRNPLDRQQFFRDWVTLSNEGQAYAIIIDNSPNPVASRAYVVKMGILRPATKHNAVAHRENWNEGKRANRGFAES